MCTFPVACVDILYFHDHVGANREAKKTQKTKVTILQSREGTAGTRAGGPEPLEKETLRVLPRYVALVRLPKAVS